MPNSRDSSPNISFSLIWKKNKFNPLYKKDLSCCVLDDTIRKDKVAFLFLAHQNRREKKEAKKAFRFWDAFFLKPVYSFTSFIDANFEKNDKNLIKKVFGYRPSSKNREVLRNDEIQSEREWIPKTRNKLWRSIFYSI